MLICLFCLPAFFFGTEEARTDQSLAHEAEVNERGSRANEAEAEAQQRRWGGPEPSGRRRRSGDPSGGRGKVAGAAPGRSRAEAAGGSELRRTSACRRGKRDWQLEQAAAERLLAPCAALTAAGAAADRAKREPGKGGPTAQRSRPGWPEPQRGEPVRRGEESRDGRIRGEKSQIWQWTDRERS